MSKEEKIEEFVATGKELTEKAIVEAKQEQEKELNKEKKYETFEKFLEDPEQQMNARLLAKQVQELVGKNWFNMNRFNRKTKGQTFGSVQLGLLIQFGHLVVKDEGKEQFYKVVFDTLDQQAIIEKQLSDLKIREKILKADLRRLKKKQKEIDKENQKEGA